MSWPIKSISLGVGGAWVLLFWLGLAAALALAVWAYRAPVPPLPRASRILLGTLRFLTLGLLVLTLFQPVITVAARAGDRPLVALLVDLSSSMALPASSTQADTTSRFDVARQVVIGLLPHLEREFEVELQGFGVDVTDIDPRGGALDRLVAGAPATALGPALGAIVRDDARRPAAVVLVSDGGVNSGRDPVALAERMAIPMITIPASLDSTVNDVWVAECLANRTAHLGQETLISVTLASHLEVATRAGVILREGDRILTREQVTLPPGPARTPVEIRFRPERLGSHRYSVEVEAIPDEMTAGNNSRSFPIRIEEERLQLLLIADRPSWDFTFIRRALAADRTLAVTALVKKDRDGNVYQPLSGAKLDALPRQAREITAFGAVVLLDVDVANLPADTRTALAGFAREGGGLLIVNAPRGNRPNPNTELERMLPARPSAAPAAPVLVTPRLTVSGSVHPVTAFGESPSRAEQMWGELPPVRMALPLEVGLAGEVLVEGVGAGEPVPLVIAGRTPSGRALIVNAALAWRWGFLLAGTTGDDVVHRRFWSEAVNWVARGQGDGNLEVHADQPVFLQGKEVTLGARLTDDDLKPVGDAEVSIEIEPVAPAPARTSPGSASGVQAESQQLVLGPADALGSYAGAAGFLPPGLYRLQGVARRGAREWTAEGAPFLVDQASIEAATPAANPDLMRRLALRTGGAMVLPGDAIDSVAKIAREQALAERTIEIKLWNHAGLFIAFVGCASLEWFLRRRRGLA